MLFQKLRQTDISQAVHSSLELMSHKSRNRFRVVVAMQTATGLLDLIGILLIGLVAILAASSIQGNPPPAIILEFLLKIGIENPTSTRVVIAVAIFAALLLISKSLLYAFLLGKIYRFLGNEQANISGRITEGFLNLPLIRIQQRSTQETAYSIVIGAFSATGGILGSYAVVLSEAALLTMIAATLVWVDPVVSIVALSVFVTVGLGIHKILGGKVSKQGQIIGDTVISGTELIQESVSFYKEITVLGRKEFFITKSRKLLEENARARADSLYFSQMPKIAYEIALVVGGIGIAGWQFTTRTPTEAIATLAIYLAAGSRMIPSMLRLSSQLIIIRHSFGQAAPMFNLVTELDTIHESKNRDSQSFTTTDKECSRTYTTKDGVIRVSGLTVAYPGSLTPALQDIEFSTPIMSTVAIVGPTGAGKSTLADVLMGLLSPQKGSVFFGDSTPEDLIHFSPGFLAYVPQETGMTNGSVRENVALGVSPHLVDDDQVWDALNRAHLSEFLVSQRSGLDTLIGERGVNLSGGQRQRLGLARALFVQPSLIILDEATSALDAETEVAISETLHSLDGSVGKIVIAHRLSTIRDADLVLYLENGRIIGKGTFEEVRKSVPQFDRQAKLMGIR